MALEVAFQITSLPEAKTGASYRIIDALRVQRATGSVNVSSDGTGSISLVGLGFSLGDWVRVTVDDFTGSNPETAGSSQDWIQVTDDGIPITINSTITNTTVQFSASSGESGLWVFGDGNTSTDLDPSHTYADPNTAYTVDFTAVAGGTATKNITTGDAPPAPTEYSVLFVGDSITAAGTNPAGSATGPSKINEALAYTLKGQWATTFFMHSTGDWIFHDNIGISGEDTTQLLARMPTVTAYGGDIIALMSGTNDYGKGIPVATTKSNWDSIVAAVMAAGKRLFIFPISYTNAVGQDAQKNIDTDEINAHLATLADTSSNIAIGPVPIEFNIRIMTDQITWGDVSYDGTHYTNYGGMLRGKGAAPVLDAWSPSVRTKSNELEAFTGTGGTLVYPTGQMADNWKALYGDAVEGPIDRGDGKVWWKLTAKGSRGSNNYTKSQIERLVPIPITELGYYTAECLLEIESGAETVNYVKLRTKADDGGFGESSIASFASNSAFVKGGFENGVQYPMTAAEARANASGMDFIFEIGQPINEPTPLVCYVTDFQMWKSRDI